MAVVPYTFANQSGQIPLSELDANFANVKAFADTAGNVTGNVQANITAVGVLTTLSVSGNVTSAGHITASGNITASNFIGNITGTISSPGSNTQVLFNDNGTANASIGLTFNKNSNVLTVAGNINSSGTVSSTGNVIGAYLFATTGNIGAPDGVTTLRIGNTHPTTIWIGGVASNVHIANTNSTTQVAGNLTAGGFVSATGNITGSNLITAGLITATGNITGSNLITSGSITATGNITGGDVTGSNFITAGLITATGNITGGNITGGNVTGSNFITAGLITATGNITGGNLNSSGSITATGNIAGGNLSIAGTSTLTGVATAPTAANGTSNTQVATTAFVTNSLLNLVPSGVIVMWSGTVASIPSGWLLCNGTSGTPDLRDRFVVGAGNIYTPGNTGGSANAIVVAHTHTASSVVSDPGHTHVNGSFTELLATNGTGTVSTTNNTPGEPQVTASANLLSSTTGITVSTTITSTGSSATNANLPPYYALAYIMKA